MDISGYGINRRCMLFCGSYNSDEENQENTNGTGTKECGIERKQMPPLNEGQNYNSIFFLLHYIYGVQVVPQLCRLMFHHRMKSLIRHLQILYYV